MKFTIISIKLVFLIIAVPVLSYSLDIPEGYLRELDISVNPQPANMTESSTGYEYLTSGKSVIVNLTDPSLESIQVGSEQMKVVKSPPSWHFYARGGGYIDKSNTKALHELQVSLPECKYGNVCEPNKAFSVSLPKINTEKSHEVGFFVNGEDVSSLFYFKNGVFSIKNFYETQFFNKFKGSNGIFSWKQGNEAGQVAIILGNKAIKGRVLDLAGKPNAIFAGKKVKLVHAGSDTIMPHEIYADINKAGEYYAGGLPSFEYNISIDVLPSAPVSLEAVSTNKDVTTLSLRHNLPRFDMIFVSDGAFNPGELVILSPTSWNARLRGQISELTQLTGDPVVMAVNKDKIALITPVERHSADDLVFHCFVGTTPVLFKLIHPVPIYSGYEQFSMFSDEGIYARTMIDNLQQGGVLPYSSNLMPVGYIDTISRILSKDVRVHYYNGATGRASDVTEYFIWSDSRQGIFGDESKQKNLYKLLSTDTGTLAMTFCDQSNQGRCFRIKTGIRPGGADLSVVFEKEKGMELDNSYIALEELHKTDNSIFRMAAIGKQQSYRFMNIPQGVYIAKILDPSLSVYGAALVEITAANNENRDIVPAIIHVTKIPANISDDALQTLARGDIIDLNQLSMHHNDYKLLNLASMGIRGAVDNVSVLGSMPGDYILYHNNQLALFSAGVPKNTDVTMLIHSGGTIFRLPIHYNSSEYVIVKEKYLDYSMCPEERPLCANAFVHLGNVSQGIYNGSRQLSITLPYDFKDIRVFMREADITDLFTISKRTLTLKKDYVPVFLSSVASDSRPITLVLPDREYEIRLTPGYKSIDASIVDRQGTQSPIYTGLNAKLSCEYLPERYYSQLSSVNSIGVVSFTNIPECAYSLAVVDKEQLFQGSVDGLTIGPGQNKLRTAFSIECVGSNNIFVENCSPLLPLLTDRKLVTPDFGLLFTDKLIDGGADSVTISPESPDISLKAINPGLLVFAPPMKDGDFTLHLANAKASETIQLSVEPLESEMLKMLAKPAHSTIQPLSVDGLNSSYVYTGIFSLTFKMGSSYKYSKDEVSIILDTRRSETNVTELFTWDEGKSTLTLNENDAGKFISLLRNKQQEFIISFAQPTEVRHYKFSVIIGSGAADINGNLTGDTAKLGKATAIIIGRKARNGFEYRQMTEVRRDLTFIFSNIPSGIYDLVVFDQAAGIYGKREIGIDRQLSDIYIEIPMQSFK